MTETLAPVPDDTSTAGSGPQKATPRWALAAGAAVIAVVAGAAGAGLTQLAFPAEQGPAGPAGRPGSVGPAGPAGTSGTSASLDTNKVGYCFDATYQYSDQANWVDSVSLFAPTSNNGTLSCTSGTFIPLTPTGPNGAPVKNYDATRPAD